MIVYYCEFDYFVACDDSDSGATLYSIHVREYLKRERICVNRISKQRPFNPFTNPIKDLHTFLPLTD